MLDEERALAYAEEWARNPEDMAPHPALTLGNRIDQRAPSDLARARRRLVRRQCHAAGIEPSRATPEQTARAVRLALFISLAYLARDAKDGIMTSCLEDGIASYAKSRALHDSGKT